ncbi:unnamed protein product [Symbiodinium sp. CCMP2592]|nr:unnamed protein product [Symbiodinium sp. CCMP2592]
MVPENPKSGTSLPLQKTGMQRMRECLSALETGLVTVISGHVEPSGDHADRCGLLQQKQQLSSQMETLRATMRHVQEDGEHCSNEARQFEAEGALDYIKVAAQRDKLQTLREQIRRSKLQAAEHRRAERELRTEVDRAKATFQEVLSVESDVQAAVRNEIGQLQQVVQDLTTRIDAKSAEIERLERANEWAAAEAAGQGPPIEGLPEKVAKEQSERCQPALGGTLRSAGAVRATGRRGTKE